MISNFLRSLLSEESDPVSTDDAQIALAALLVRIAKSDSQYDKSEVCLLYTSDAADEP